MTHAAAYRGQRVLVTGATGFIGWHVAEALDQAGAEVYCVARPGSGGRDGLPSPRGVLLHEDLARPGAAGRLVAQCLPAVTFNLAGYGVDRAERSESLAERLNGELPGELGDACARWRDPAWQGQHLVHAGSALEYGVASGDLSEETPVRPTTLYGTTKAAGTAALLASASREGLPAAVARLFTVFGPREHAGRLLPSLCRAARETGPVPLTSGEQRRDFTWVGDVANGLLRLGTVRATSVGIVNLATGRLVTVREFIERAAAILGIDRDRLQFGALPTRPEEMAHDPVNVNRLEALTGWRPDTSIEAAVRATMQAG